MYLLLGVCEPSFDDHWQEDFGRDLGFGWVIGSVDLR